MEKEKEISNHVSLIISEFVVDFFYKQKKSPVNNLKKMYLCL